jgi:hypothetical protein
MGLRPVEIDEGSQDDGHFYFGPGEDVVDQDSESRSFRMP